MIAWLVALVGVVHGATVGAVDPVVDCPALASEPRVATASWSAAGSCADVAFALDQDDDNYADDAGRCCVAFVCTSPPDTDPGAFDTDTDLYDTDAGTCVPSTLLGDFLWEPLLTSDSVIDCDPLDFALNVDVTFYADCDGDDVTSDTSIVACDATEALTSTVCGGSQPLKVSTTESSPNDCNDDDNGVSVVDDWYIDCDGDGVAASAAVAAVCGDAAALATCGAVSNSAGAATATTTAPSPGDCDDTDGSGSADQSWYLDCDADGVAAGAAVTACGKVEALASCSSPEVGADASTTAPGTPDCDDEDDALATTSGFFLDCDGDGLTTDTAVTACGEAAAIGTCGSVSDAQGPKAAYATASATTDCDDEDGDTAGPEDWYNDCDDDGIFTDTPVQACSRNLAEDLCADPNPGNATQSAPAEVDRDCDDDDDGEGAPGALPLDCDGDGVTGNEFKTFCTIVELLSSGETCSDGNPPANAELFPDSPSDCDDFDGTASVELPWFLDCDGDGKTQSTSQDFCGQAAAIASCGAVSAQAFSTVSNPTDCDDTKNGVGGPSTWYLDCDGDGVVASTYTVSACAEVDALTSGACPAGADPVNASTTLPSTPDCNDDLAAASAVASWFLDCDNDGVTGSLSVSACGSAAALAQNACSNGNQPLAVFAAVSSPIDCNDLDFNAQSQGNWYRDCDGDGAYDGTAFLACGELGANNLYKCGIDDADSWTGTAPSAAAEDCDDDRADEFPGQVWFPDCDGDGAFRAASTTACLETEADAAGLCDDASAPDGGWVNATPPSPDCDDEDSTGSVSASWYADCDGDGFFDDTVVPACGRTGALANATCSDGTIDDVTNVDPGADADCADDDSTRFPGAPEVCNGLDDDCDGGLPASEQDGDGDLVIACQDCNDGDITGSVAEAWYPDCDGDGFFDDVTWNACGVTGASTLASCGAPADASRWTTTAPALADVDCDDADDVEFPGRVWFADCDDDGSFNAAGIDACTVEDAVTATTCVDGGAPDGGWYSDETATLLPPPAEDCDDEDGTATAVEQWYPDCDGDGAFDGTPVSACGLTAAQATYDCTPLTGSVSPLGGFTSVDPGAGADCDDGRADEFPGQVWYPDCDGDTVFSATSTTACLQSEAEAAGLCGDDAAPDGGWVNTAPTVEDCDDEDDIEFPGREWYPNCDDDSSFGITVVTACTVEDAVALSPCVDAEAPDGGWYPYTTTDPAPTGDLIDCNDEDPTGSAPDTWYRDCDGDGFEDSLSVDTCGASGADGVNPCPNGAGVSAWTTSPSSESDCDDADADEFPNRSWFADCDDDGRFDATATVACAVEDAEVISPCDSGSSPLGGWYADSGATALPSDQQDCDDEDASAFEVESWYADCDGDGAFDGSALSFCGLQDALATYDCPAPNGVVAPLGSFTNVDPAADADCDDGRADEFPGQVWFPDCDGDGAFASTSTTACLETEADAASLCADDGAPDGGWVNTTPSDADCDDEDGTEFPGRPWFADCDDDGAFSPTSVSACAVEDAVAITPCQDAAEPDGGWFPWSSGTPSPDVSDQDCDDEDATGRSEEDWYRDCDADGFDDPTSTRACGTTGADAANPCPAGPGVATWTTTPSAGDCDDADATEFPTRVWYADCDGDGAFRDSGTSACSEEEAGTAGVSPCDDDAAPDGGWFAFATGSPAPDAAIADCLDEDALSFPGQVWYPDCDGDGAYDDPTVGLCKLAAVSDDAVIACSESEADTLTPCLDGEAPDGGWSPGAIPTDTDGAALEDCDDTTTERSPLLTAEICEGVGQTQIDDDCNCDVNSSGPPDDLEDPTNPSAFYRDQDGDGFGADDQAAVVFGCQVADDQSITNTDCDDFDPDVYLGAPETCDGIDQNCNGVVDEPDALGDDANCAPLYLDLDGDGFGDPLVPECLCATTNEDGDLVATFNGNEYVQLNTDCDDAHAFIRPDACNNGLDDDEDGLLDADDEDCGSFPWPVAEGATPRSFRTAVETSDCEDGEDGDGDGLIDDADPDCAERFPGLDVEVWPRREGDACANGKDDDGDGLADDADPDCAPVTTTISGVVRQLRPSFESVADLIASGLVRKETADGHDNECDGKVPIVELDCDDDGSLPVPAAALDAYYSAEDLGLARCVDEPRQMSCWGEQLSIECDEVTGLWVTRYGSSDDGFGGRYSGAYRNLTETGCSATLDCDDQCATRCPGASESCDGLDNDCSGTAASDLDDDGIPDALDVDVPVLGTVSSAEIDLDGDEALACEEDFRATASQVQVSPYTCTVGTELGTSDCTALCYLASPGREEFCNGFVDACGAAVADREGTDEDEDGYVTCGAYGPSDGSLVEQVFVPVWVSCLSGGAVDTDGNASDVPEACDGVDTSMLDGSEPPLVPLIAPRGADVVCDDPLREAQALVLSRAGAGDAPSDGSGLVRALCDGGSGGVCTVVVLELDATNVLEIDPVDAIDAGTLPEACAEADAALRARTVWSRERVVEARQATVELECLRLYGAPCDEVTTSSQQVGTSVPPDLGEALSDETLWWLELQRFRPAAAEGALMDCWGDPRVRTISTDVGGDCDDTRADVHRDVPEGPDDVVTVFGTLLGAEAGVDCSACFDGLDNNCDGAADCADPSCAVCFVGGGTGCSSGRDACAEPGEGCASAGARPMAGVFLLVGLLARRRRRRLVA